MSRRVRKRVLVRECNLRNHPQPCFHGYCGACRRVLSKYDESREQCLAICNVVLDKGEHDCPKGPIDVQQELFVSGEGC